jgi:PAB1-binding protein PBP1
LESSNGSSNLGAWDQFAENEKRFGLKSDYREEIYTTTIDKSNPEFQKRMAKADRIAREIEKSTSTNAHVLEERIRDNLTADKSGRDEEDKSVDCEPISVSTANA